jgi:pyruvate kinase
MVERQLRLVWGVLPVHSRKATTTDQTIRDMIDLSVNQGLAREGDRVVVTAGAATNTSGATNLMTVETIKKLREPTR